jgi:hypothetical protein
VGRLHDLVRHGPDYLTREEFEVCLERKLSEYYEFLALSLARRWDKKFWNYHKSKLNDAGVGFSRVRLARATLAKVCDAILNPKDTIEKLLKRSNVHTDPKCFQGNTENDERKHVLQP